VFGKPVLAFGVAAAIFLQFVPLERTNPLGAGGPDVSIELQWTRRRACYDCQSNETRWPIWAYVAPFSWMVVRDVDAPLEKLPDRNLSAAGRGVPIFRSEFPSCHRSAAFQARENAGWVAACSAGRFNASDEH
jgi:hypothetical protein